MSALLPARQQGSTAGWAADGGRDVLIIGWLLDPQHLDRQDDFYFGDLQERLERNGLTSLLALRNHTRSHTDTLIARARRMGPRARTLLPDFLHLRDEIRLLRRVARARDQLRADIPRRPSRLDRLAAREAYRHMTPPLVLPSLRLYEQVRALVAALRPRIVITLHEGHGWERCVWSAVRSSSDALRVGYQHTVLFRLSHAMRRSLARGGEYDPDVLLTSGEITATDISQRSDLGAALVPFGSYRRPAPTGMAAAPSGADAVLVLPDGTLSETSILFDFAIRSARAIPGTPFVLRTHPLVQPREAIERLGALPRNVEVSSGRSLEEDLRRCRAVLYRGSSAALTSVLAGLKAFYLERDGELRFDPLERLDTWRERIGTVEALSSALERDREYPEKGRLEEWQEARSFCDRYLAPISDAAIAHLVRRGATHRLRHIPRYPWHR